MKFDNKDSENLKNDYFEGPDLEDTVEKKTPKKKPEDPDYYDDYIPISMMGASNDFYNFVVDSYERDFAGCNGRGIGAGKPQF